MEKRCKIKWSHWAWWSFDWNVPCISYSFCKAAMFTKILKIWNLSQGVKEGNDNCLVTVPTVDCPTLSTWIFSSHFGIFCFWFKSSLHLLFINFQKTSGSANGGCVWDALRMGKKNNASDYDIPGAWRPKQSAPSCHWYFFYFLNDSLAERHSGVQ